MTTTLSAARIAPLCNRLLEQADQGSGPSDCWLTRRVWTAVQ
ncbi:MAG: hypothetical protein RBR41_04495 [Desulfovibrio sp.]|nr:hypothetical protein [Desulfovibrio sp.]MDY0258910.1 hypothetical protein [Desulfovibrio sp.]